MDLFSETRTHKKRTHRKSYHIKKAKLIPIKTKFRKHRKGWHYESNRHRLASKGIKTGHREGFASLFHHKQREKEKLNKKEKGEIEQPSETKEQINYLYEWQDLKGNFHTTEKKPRFWEHKGNISKVPFGNYMKSASVGQKFKKQTDEQKARLEKENGGELL